MGLIVRNLRAFRGLQKRLDDVARGGFVEDIAKRVGATLLKQVSDEFRDSRDPYGEPWAPVYRNRRRDRLARRRRAARGLPVRADKPLVDTGRLKASPVARVSGRSVRIALPVAYASFHNEGTRRIRKRQILPDAGRGLGPHWGPAVRKETMGVLTKTLKGKW